MKTNRNLSYAIATILSARAVTVFAGGQTAGSRTPGAAAEGQIGEIIVTAQRREENSQTVPITIQTLTAETLTQLNVQTFDDFVRYLPNVSAAGSGPGMNDVYMRGLATNGGDQQGSGTTGSFPNVAVYIDDQAGQIPGRNLDLYAVDLERIEVLEGPQGTLFGAGAEAGVIRYITNKPKLNVTEFNADAGYATTAHGDPSSGGDLTVNLPLIQDKLAVRAVVYDESRGGYIDNIPSTFARAATDKVVVNYFGGVVPPNSGPINNYSESGRAINPVTYKGIRGEVLYKFNEQWNALITQSYQSIDAEGVFWEEEYDGLGKPLPDLSVALFNPSYNKEHFENTAWTLNGLIGDLQLVYTGSYLDRVVDQSQDYTNYSRGTYAGYYQCNYPGYPFVGGKPTAGSSGYCYSPSTFWAVHQHSSHQSHELRSSTSADSRLRAIGGLFWEDYRIHDGTDWHYGTSPNFYPIGPPSINPYTTPPTSLPATSANPNVRPLGDAFFDDILRGYEQKAAFASVDFDAIPKVLTITAGTRWYDTQDFESGSNVGSFGCEIYGPYDGGVPPNPCVSTVKTGVLSNLNNLDAKHLRTTYVGFRSRANVSWHVTPDAMVYATWSQGYRPGGFNRAAPVLRPSSPLYGIWAPPIAYGPDTLTNYELGWKTEWFDHRLRFNGAVYQENWDNVQVRIFDPGVTGNLTFLTNGPNYRVRGVEPSLSWRVFDPLTITGSASWNSSENVKNLHLVNPKTGQPVTNVANPFGELGQPLAVSPPFQANLRARCEFNLDRYNAFAQVGGTHQAHSYASTISSTTTLQGVTTDFDDPGFTIYDASAGIGSGPWMAQLDADNLTDKRAILYASYAQTVKMDTVNRPRTIGLRFSYRFSAGK